MENSDYPEDIKKIIGALIKLFRHQGYQRPLNILESAKARIEYTGSENSMEGEIYLYTLFLEIPFALFAFVEPKLSACEKEIETKIGSILRHPNGHFINCVTIGPDLDEVAADFKKRKPTPETTNHIWKSGFLRLFLSHVSKHKQKVAHLKECLQIYGVSAFVAHEDIEPSLEWQQEIELALDTMHSLAAFLTHEFKTSLWVDQEIGFALGKDVFIIPVKVGINPYGFLAKKQGLPGDLDEPIKLAADIVDILLKNEKTNLNMKQGLILAMETSSSWPDSIKIISKLEKITNFTQQEFQRLEAAFDNNPQVAGAFGVPEKIKAIMKKFGYS